jgi:hypothetical protein
MKKFEVGKTYSNGVFTFKFTQRFGSRNDMAQFTLTKWMGKNVGDSKTGELVGQKKVICAKNGVEFLDFFRDTNLSIVTANDID